MGSPHSKRGKGQYLKYKNEGRLQRNQESDERQHVRNLEKRKAWRIAKYAKTPQTELSCTTVSLFREWGVPLVGPKRQGKKGNSSVKKV
jgi:hypothetical protein